MNTPCQFELLDAIMSACGMPKLENVSRCELIFDFANGCVPVLKIEYIPDCGRPELLKREFHVQAVEVPQPECAQVASMSFDSLWVKVDAMCTYEFESPQQCPDCHGTGIYRGINEEGPCKTCCGENPKKSS